MVIVNRMLPSKIKQMVKSEQFSHEKSGIVLVSLCDEGLSDAGRLQWPVCDITCLLVMRGTWSHITRRIIEGMMMNKSVCNGMSCAQINTV